MIYRNCPLRTLDASNEVGGKLCLPGKRLLCQFRLYPAVAQILGKDVADIHYHKVRLSDS